MKKFLTKTIIITAVLCISVFALTACNNEKTPEPVTEEQQTTEAEAEATEVHEYEDLQSTVETADDYFKVLETFTNAAKYVKTDLANRLAQIDTADATKVAEVTAIVNKPFEQMKSVQAPAEYAESNKLYVNACDQILAYISKTANGEDASSYLAEAQSNINKANEQIANDLYKNGNKDAAAE